MEAGRGAGLLPAGQPHGMRGYAQIQAEIACCAAGARLDE